MNATHAGQAYRPTHLVDSEAMSPDDLLGLLEVAQLLDVSQSTAKNYARRPDFPAAEKLSRGRVWRRADVVKWNKTVRPKILTGRPPKPR